MKLTALALQDCGSTDSCSNMGNPDSHGTFDAVVPNKVLASVAAPKLADNKQDYALSASQGGQASTCNFSAVTDTLRPAETAKAHATGPLITKSSVTAHLQPHCDQNQSMEDTMLDATRSRGYNLGSQQGGSQAKLDSNLSLDLAQQVRSRKFSSADREEMSTASQYYNTVTKESRSAGLGPSGQASRPVCNKKRSREVIIHLYHACLRCSTASGAESEGHALPHELEVQKFDAIHSAHI